jgi:hypothetical protein
VLLFRIAQRLFFKASTDARAQQRRVERLRKIIFGPGLDAPNNTVHLIEGGDHDDWNMAGFRVRFYRLQDGVTVKPLHHDIQQNQVERLCAYHFQSLLPIDCGLYD